MTYSHGFSDEELLSPSRIGRVRHARRRSTDGSDSYDGRENRHHTSTAADRDTQQQGQGKKPLSPRASSKKSSTSKSSMLSVSNETSDGKDCPAASENTKLQEVRGELWAMRREMWLMEQRMISAFGEELRKMRADLRLSSFARRYEDIGPHSNSQPATVMVTTATSDSNSTGEKVARAVKERKRSTSQGIDDNPHLFTKSSSKNASSSRHGHGKTSGDKMTTPTASFSTPNPLKKSLDQFPMEVQQQADLLTVQQLLSKKKREAQMAASSGSSEIVKATNSHKRRVKKSKHDHVEDQTPEKDEGAFEEQVVSPSTVHPALRTSQQKAEMLAREQVRRNLEHHRGTPIMANPLYQGKRLEVHPAPDLFSEFCNMTLTTSPGPRPQSCSSSSIPSVRSSYFAHPGTFTIGSPALTEYSGEGHPQPHPPRG